MKNGEVWRDNEGKPIHAHGGCRLEYQNRIYWYGENRSDDNYVSCYASDDGGKTWSFANNVLTCTSVAQKMFSDADLSLKNSLGGKVNIERPKVLYNAKTNRFVLWGHYENGQDYHSARCMVASCDTPDGDFLYHGSFRPLGNMSRDCTLFQERGKAYFISASNDNADLHIYRLSEDFLTITKHVNTLFSAQYREAPAIIKKDGVYLLITSECTGWLPNQGGYSISTDIEGKWSELVPIGDKTTYKSQAAFLYMNVDGEIVFLGDRWGGNDFTRKEDFQYEKSGYAAYRVVMQDDKAQLIYSEEAFQ